MLYQSPSSVRKTNIYKDFKGLDMKVINSLKSAKTRDKNCRVVRRKGRVYVINKTNPKLKARQG